MEDIGDHVLHNILKGNHLIRDKWGKNMPKILVNLNDEEDRQVLLHKIKKGYVTKQEALKDLVMRGSKYSIEQKRQKDESGED